jgi:short-subunit dehydrogenase
MRLSFILFIALVAVFGTLVWNKLDANPSLFFYEWVFPAKGNNIHNLSKQTIWVTGASSGIGASIVCALVQAQAKHVILSSRSTEKLEMVLQECQQKFPESSTNLSIVRYDAMDSQTTQDTVLKAKQISDGGIDVLIMNCGVYQNKPALETSIAETNRITRINYLAPVELSNELILQDHWKERGHGHLVVSASVMAKGPFALCSSYAASKAALKNYFQTLSTEEFSWLKVQTVIIGGTKTNMWQSLNYDVHQPNDSALMDPDRVAHLMVRAISCPYWWFFYEVWTTKNIGWLYLVLSHYTPSLHYLMNHLIGLARKISFRHDHSDLLDLKIIIKNLASVFWK